MFVITFCYEMAASLCSSSFDLKRVSLLIFRNALSESSECRQRLRETRGLVAILIYTMTACASNEDFSSKTMENCVCIIRNLSFALQEIRDPAYLVRREAQFYAAVSNPVPSHKRLVFRKTEKKAVGLILSKNT